MLRFIYLLVLFAASLVPGQAEANFVAFDDPARWGAATQFFTTENFDGVAPEVHPGCTSVVEDLDCGAGTFVLTDFHIETPDTSFNWSIGPDGFGGLVEGVFRCLENGQGACYFDMIFDKPISAIGLYLDSFTSHHGDAVPPFGIDVFVGASDFLPLPGHYPPDTEPFFKPDTDAFLGLVSDTAFSQIRFVEHDVPVPPFTFPDRTGHFTLSRVDYRLVPEPATFALLATAFAGMGLARRRKPCPGGTGK